MMKILRSLSFLVLVSLAFLAQAQDKKSQKSLNDLRLVQGDEGGNEVKSLKAELLVLKAEAAAIQQAQRLLKKYQGTQMEPEIQFRLAELYMRKAKNDRFFELHRESETVVRVAPRIVREASSRNTIKKAVDTYASIAKRWPNFRQMDLVIFNHAFARQALGDIKDAEKLYRSLIARHPDSPLVPDAHLAIGEIEFDRNQFAKALDQFNAIRKYPQSRVYPYGLYKAAWTHYNLRDAAQGLRKLEAVVLYGKTVAKTHADLAKLDLRKEALNDMTLFFEEVYPAEAAYDYFREQAGDDEVGAILLRMANLYERHSRFADQRTVLDKFMAKLPRSPLLPEVLRDLVEAHDQLRQKDRSVARLEQYASLCVPTGEWVKAQTKSGDDPKKVGEQCLTSLNETAFRLAQKWLRAWKKLPNDTSYADASEKAFEIYLRTPSESEEALQSRFSYAELLFSRAKFRQASAEYAIVGSSAKASSLRHDAGYGAVLSLEKAVGEKWSSEDEKAFNKLAEDYVAKNPKGQYRLDMEYKMALLAYERNRYDEAAPRFLRLGREFPQLEKGIKSQDLYLDILNIKKDYRGIRNYAQEIIKASSDSARDAKMSKLYQQAYFLEIQSLEEKNNWKQALAEYQAFSKQNPTSDLNEQALFNSMQLHFKLGDDFNGSKAALEFASRYPKSNQATNALLRAAQTFEQMAQLAKAAEVLEKLAEREPKDSARWRELAADFYAMDGVHARARAMYMDLKDKAKDDNRVRLMTKIEAFEKNYGTTKSHGEALRALIDRDLQPYAGSAKVQTVEALYDKGQYTEAFNDARRWLGSSALSKNHKARLRLVQAKVLELEFLKASVKSRAERVATVLAIKTEKLQKAQEALQSAIKYGDPRVSIDAFERLYGCYTHYVKSLKEMPVPEGVNAGEAQAFRAELDKLVIPLEEKAVDTLAQAVTFARRQSFLDGTAARLEAELARVNQQQIGIVLPETQKPQVVVPMITLAEVGL